VILDYSMPVFNGEQVAQAIRQQWPAVGIIMLSGYPELPQSSLHVSDVLIREGASPLELLAALERLTGERPTPKVPAEVERSRELIKKIGESFPRMPARKGKIE
jgi:DNA-binding response OmpR family regulator